MILTALEQLEYLAKTGGQDKLACLLETARRDAPGPPADLAQGGECLSSSSKANAKQRKSGGALRRTGKPAWRI